MRRHQLIIHLLCVGAGAVLGASGLFGLIYFAGIEPAPPPCRRCGFYETCAAQAERIVRGPGQ